MSSQLVLIAVRGKKLLHNIATGHSHTTKTCFNDVIVFSMSPYSIVEKMDEIGLIFAFIIMFNCRNNMWAYTGSSAVAG
jgi:hypothetical protein